VLSAREFHLREPVPLARVHEAILEFCRGREDLVVFGAQAVNVHVGQLRMTEDVDLLARAPRAVAEELAAHLRALLQIATRVRVVKPGAGFRVYQPRKEGTRHLADVRLAEVDLGEPDVKDGVRYTSAPVTLAMKVCALHKRRFAPKGATDLADVRRLLLAHPKLRQERGVVSDLIGRIGEPGVVETWQSLLSEPLVSDAEVDEGY
jgi:hypothetical protein